MAEKKKAAPPKPVVRIVDPAEREKVLKTAMAQLEKKFGEGTVMFMGENRRMDIESISTGSLMLDLALGIGAVVHIHSENAVVELVVAVHKRLVLCDNILVVQWSGNEPCERCGGHF